MPPISRFPVPEFSELEDDIQQMLQDVQQKAGFIPNVFITLAHRPDELRAFFAYHEAVMSRPSGLSKAEKEMIVVATSAENNCLYCVIAHGAILRIYENRPLIADQIAINYRKADITARQRAMLDFAVKLAHHSSQITEDDFEKLYIHGWSDEDIWDMGAITALFGLSNRMANLISMQPNEEFFTMGRVARPPKNEV